MTEKELIIKAGEELDAKLAEAKKTGNLVVKNATEDESVIRSTFEKGRRRVPSVPGICTEKIRKSRTQTETSSGRLFRIRYGKRFHYRALVCFHNRSSERRNSKSGRRHGLCLRRL